MTPERHARASELFLAALERVGPSQQAFLDDACGGDVELRREVETLLARDARSAVVDTPVLQTPLGDWVGGAGELPAAPPQRIGRYEILGVLGEGGDGHGLPRAADAARSRRGAQGRPRSFLAVAAAALRV